MASPTIDVIRRDNINLRVRVTDKSSTPAAPVDITDWTVFFTVKRNLNQPDSAAVISKTITDHTNPTIGETIIALSTDEMDIREGLYYYDFQIKGSNGINSTRRGVFSVSDDVTVRES